MQAIIYRRYGSSDVLELADISPPQPRRDEVLVRVACAALNPKDALFRRGKFGAISGRRFPKRCGLDLAGVVVESRANAFTPGQRVFGFFDEWTFQRGSLAELVACRERELAPIPEGVTDASAAGIALAGSTALQALRDSAGLRPGDRLLVHGASGGVGTAAIQIGRLLGAEVHSVSSAANTALCSELGAHRAWTYPEHGWKGDAPFGVIFDVFGTLDFREARAHLTPRGRFVSTVPSPKRLLRELVARVVGGRERLVIVKPTRPDLTQLGDWITRGDLRTVIDSTHPLTGVKDAFARLESKRARGKIIVEVSGGPPRGPRQTSA